MPVAASIATSIATLTWHDLKPIDVPIANLISCFELNFAIFCGYIWVTNRLYTFKICLPERSGIYVVFPQAKQVYCIHHANVHET